MNLTYWEVIVLENDEIKAVFFIDTNRSFIIKSDVDMFYFKYIQPIEAMFHKDYHIIATYKHVNWEVDNDESI